MGKMSFFAPSLIDKYIPWEIKKRQEMSHFEKLIQLKDKLIF
jgi:hypothetical protein